MRFAILLAAILLCIALERLARFRYRQAPFFRNYFTTDLAYIGTALALGAWMAAVFVGPLTDWVEATVRVPRIARLEFPRWVLVPIALAFYDFGSWFTHFMLHRSDTLWEIHKVHHSARVVDWLATFRSHVLEQVLRNVVPPALLIVAGVPLDATLLAAGLYAAFAVFNHSNTRLNLRLAEPVFITPRLHRMHHLTGATCQKNFGTVFTIWDRLYGSFVADDGGGDEFGVPGESRSYPQTWLRQFAEPIRRIAGRAESAGRDAAPTGQ